MARKLSIKMLAKKIGIAKTIAANATQHGCLPSNMRIAPIDLVAAIRQLPIDSPAREQIFGRLTGQRRYTFNQWCMAFIEASKLWDQATLKVGLKIRQCALQNCIDTATTFSHWQRLRDDYLFSCAIQELGQIDHIVEKMVDTTKTFGQLRKTLHYQEANRPEILGKIISKLNDCATTSRWLLILGDRCGTLSFCEARVPLYRAALEYLEKQATTFSEIKRIVDTLPFTFCDDARPRLYQKLVKRAKTTRELKIVQDIFRNTNLKGFKRQISSQLIRRMCTYEDWASLHCTNRSQRRDRIHNMRRLAKTFPQWERIYVFETSARKDLEQMIEIGTLADWSGVLLIKFGERGATLLEARNEAFAAHLR